MRLEFGALPWEVLGSRPVMMTLTYPGDWRRWVPDARTLVKHREAMKERWRRRYSAPVGVWVVEFQRRGAPHLHLYLGLPAAVTHKEYRSLQIRTMRRQQLQRQIGAYEARAQLRAPGGEFALWLRTAWWEIVGSGSRAHHGRGVDLAVMFFSERAEEVADRVRVAEYLWRESGKWAQKQPPEDFGSLRFYGRWGEKQGFRPIITTEQVSEHAGYEIRRVLRHLQMVKRRQDAAKRGYRFRPDLGGTRGRDGLTVFEVDGKRLAARLLPWAEELAMVKAAQGGGAPAQVWTSFRRPALRAFSQLQVADPEDPEVRYEKWVEEQEREEAALEAAIERYLAGDNEPWDDRW